MIHITEPALMIHAHDAPFPDFYSGFRTTIRLRRRVMIPEVVGHILGANALALVRYGCPLQHIFFNCHGLVGRAAIAGSGVYPGIQKTSIHHFAPLAHLNLGTFWFLSCEMALGKEGKDVCALFAKTVKAIVVASDKEQDITVKQGVQLFFGPERQIDDMEGRVFKFFADGDYTEMQNIKEEIANIW